MQKTYIFVSMIEFAKHIEILLLTNDCVIVPGLGGFITNHAESRYDERDNTFLPPYRVVGFNQHLTYNDGLLTQSYMQAYDTSFPEATRIVNAKVCEIKEILRDKGSYTLHGIGTITMNIEGKLEFSCTANSGVTSPRLYGLSSFHMLPLEQIQTNVEESANAEEDIQETTAPRITISLSPTLVRNIAAACLAVILFFTMSTPVENTAVPMHDEAILSSGRLFSTIEDRSYITSIVEIPAETKVAAKPEEETISKNKKELTVSKAEAKAEPNKTAEAKKSPETKESKNVKDTEPVATGKYSIVLASHVTQSNAEEYIQKLSKAGLKEARIYKRNNMTRVIYSSFRTESEAQASLNKMRKESKEFSDAWVYELK